MTRGVAALPMVLVEGVLLSEGRYPTREELSAALARQGAAIRWRPPDDGIRSRTPGAGGPGGEATRHLFLTGKGGWGRPPTPAPWRWPWPMRATVLLVSTDPASNLSDVLGVAVGSGPRWRSPGSRGSGR
jgi:hypothetical protein